VLNVMLNAVVSGLSEVEAELEEGHSSKRCMIKLNDYTTSH
jgi:hypothetical protein